MASFVYYWKTSDNQRHEGEIEAIDRDAAFALLRERGIRAIKVEPRGWETGKGYRGLGKRAVAALVIGVAAIIGVLSFLLGRGVPQNSPAIGADAADARRGGSFQIAHPLERQRILGDRTRIENCPTNLFRHTAETLFGRFAEPGRPIPELPATLPTESELRACLKESIRISSLDLTEYIDLKRIVAGMKRECSAYIEGGGSIDGYFTELLKRQKMEIAYRDKAEKRLEQLTGGQSPDLSAAYAYWLKANASLQAMGIYPLSLPEKLRRYQLSLDIDTEEGVPSLKGR